MNPLLCAINWDRFPFKINMYFKTLMPGHALEIFNETDKIEIYHHINQFEINPFYYEEVQFLIQRGVHSIETKAVNCLLIFEK